MINAVQRQLNGWQAPFDILIASMFITNLLCQLAFGLIAMTICLPSMQEWGTVFGVSQARVQLTFSGFVVAFGLFQLVHGALVDRYGHRVVLMGGLGLAAVGSALAALAPNLEGLVAARVIQGAGSAAGMVVGRALVQERFDGPQRTKIMAYIGMAMGLSPPLAALVGGQLHVRWGWQSNFVLMMLLALVLFAAAWRGLPRPKRNPQGDGHWLGVMVSAYVRLLGEKTLLLYVAILAMTSAAFYVFLAGAPIVLRSYGVGPGDMGWFIMSVPVAYILGNFLTSRLIQSNGESRVMALGQLSTLASLLLLLSLAFAGVNTPLAFTLPLILMGLGHGLLMPPTLAGTVGVMPTLAGSAAALAGLTQKLMGALGGFSVGLVPHHGSRNVGWLMLGFTLCATGAHLLLHRRKARLGAVPG